MDAAHICVILSSSTFQIFNKLGKGTTIKAEVVLEPDDGHEVLCCDISVVLLVQLVEDLVQNLEIKMMIKRGTVPSSRVSRLSYGFCKYIGAKMTNDVGYPPHQLVNTGSWFMYCQVCTLELIDNAHDV